MHSDVGEVNKARKITVSILGRKFPLTAQTPQQERMFRDAAEKVNEKYSEFTKGYSGQTAEEILAIIAFNAFVEVLSLEAEAREREKKADDLLEKLRGYLKNIDLQK